MFFWKKESCYEELFKLKTKSLKDINKKTVEEVLSELCQEMNILELKLLKNEKDIYIPLEKTLIKFISLLCYEFGAGYIFEYFENNKNMCTFKIKDMEHFQKGIIAPFFTLRKNIAYYMIDHTNGIRLDSLFDLCKYYKYSKDKAISEKIGF